MRLARLMGLVTAIILGLSALSGVTFAGVRAADTHAKAEKLVKFEGHWINLAKDWGAARACVVWEQAHAWACFRTEAELAQHVAQVKQTQVGAFSIAASCSSALNLYQDNNFGGR